MNSLVWEVSLKVGPADEMTNIQHLKQQNLSNKFIGILFKWLVQKFMDVWSILQKERSQRTQADDRR